MIAIVSKSSSLLLLLLLLLDEMGSDFVFGVGSAVVAEEGAGTFLADDQGEAEEDEHEEAGDHEGDPDVVEVQHPLSET
jgi:hypothetical protein